MTDETHSAAGSETGTDGAALDRLNANIAKMETLSKRLALALSARQSSDQGLQGPGQDLYMKAAAAYMAEMMTNPGRMIERQVSFWGQSLKHAVEAQAALADCRPLAPADTLPADRRFKNPLWQSHPYFNFVKQQYQISSGAIADIVRDLEGLEPADKARVEFFSQQIVDLFSPSNFLATNPDALERAVATEGDSLVAGLENLVRDIEANHGDWLVTLSDREAFKIGENIAATEGSVVFRNRMFELIQYAPTTEQVHKTPLILFPPWINKFYVLDLKEQNSLIKWIVDQGYTLFVVSWVNPDATYADVSMETYIEEGYLTAIDVVREMTGEKQINAIGYCIAGTTLALTLSLMKKRGDTSIKTATFFTTMTDFSDRGEMGVFLGDDFVDGIEREAAAKGYLNKFFMSRTFSYLRSNDLVYGPAIKSYMLGEAPPAFDLLYWNGDGTNLPGKMVVQYLRDLCLDNRFYDGTCQMFGETLALSDVEVPVFSIACETDHIAAWKSSFRGVARMGSTDKTFIVSESGHIAGIVNPPSRNKYGHYTNSAAMTDSDSWMEKATFQPGSWWPRWEAWLAKTSGKMVPARVPGDSTHAVLEPAPGSYVTAIPSV